MPRYCIIGAGAAGLAALRVLQREGFAVDCFERSHQVGGHWNTDYECLHLITSSHVTGLSELPMPEHPLFPAREQMVAYLNRYADTFGLRELIEFGVSVDAVSPLGERGEDGWTVTLSDGRALRYDGVLIANGHLHDPQIPSYPGTFTGKQLHSGEYQNTDDIDGRRVLVVGAGNSGCDLAVDAAQRRLETSISIRGGRYFQPKTFLGKPRSELPFMAQFSPDEQDLLTRLLIRLSVGTAQDYPGLQEPAGRTLAENAPVVNNLLLYWIHHGRITARPGISRFEGKTVHFDDGSFADFDTILWATGFHASVPFVSEHLFSRSRGVPLRVGAGIVPLNLERLYLIGLTAPRGPQPPVYETQAEVVTTMLHLWERGLGPTGLGKHLTDTQLADDRIDIVRHEWLEQIEATRAALAHLEAPVEVTS